MSPGLEELTSAPAVVTCERLGECTGVITVRGRFDATAAPAVGELLSEAVTAGCHDFVIDLSTVVSADTSGVCTLVDARRHVLPEDAIVVIAASDRRLLHLLDLVALTSMWPIEPTRTRALAALLRTPV